MYMWCDLSVHIFHNALSVLLRKGLLFYGGQKFRLSNILQNRITGSSSVHAGQMTTFFHAKSLQYMLQTSHFRLLPFLFFLQDGNSSIYRRNICMRKIQF